jgi:hypothetical protein
MRNINRKKNNESKSDKKLMARSRKIPFMALFGQFFPKWMR